MSSRGFPSLTFLHKKQTVGAFRYDTLEPDHIRLVTLLPGTRRHKIRCHVTTQSLEGPNLDFEALSWTWGVSKEEELIEVNDSVLSVKKTLHAALRGLRKPDTPRVLWIDAICINQQDDEEKILQLPLMVSIYTKSKSVVMWLGKSNKDVDWAVRCCVDNQTEHFKTARFFMTLVEIKSRSWFSRLWVVQEVSLHKADPLFVFDNNVTLPWTSFFSAFKQAYTVLFAGILGELPTSATLSPALIKELLKKDVAFMSTRWDRHASTMLHLKQVMANDMELIRTRAQRSSYPWMIDCLVQLHQSQCSRPEDRVYGILGLLHPKGRELYLSRHPIRLQHDIGKLYTSVALFIMTEESRRSLELYDRFRMAKRQDSTCGSMPTWVPDLGSPRSSGRR